MDDAALAMVWRQYGAALDTLRDAIEACPDELWTSVLWSDDEDPRYGQLWFSAYHAVMWADLFLAGSREAFTPPAPFVKGRLPDRPYPQAEVLGYLDATRERCRTTLLSLTAEQARRVCVFEWMSPPYLELQLYAMRHVQEHAAQLSMVLGGHGVTGLDWHATAREAPAGEA